MLIEMVSGALLGAIWSHLATAAVKDRRYRANLFPFTLRFNAETKITLMAHHREERNGCLVFCDDRGAELMRFLPGWYITNVITETEHDPTTGTPRV